MLENDVSWNGRQNDKAEKDLTGYNMSNSHKNRKKQEATYERAEKRKKKKNIILLGQLIENKQINYR